MPKKISKKKITKEKPKEKKARSTPILKSHTSPTLPVHIPEEKKRYTPTPHAPRISFIKKIVLSIVILLREIIKHTMANKRISFILVVMVAVLCYGWYTYRTHIAQKAFNIFSAIQIPIETENEETITLENGYLEIEENGSYIIERKNVVSGNISEDTIRDYASILIFRSAGTGTFFTALIVDGNTNTLYQDSLGDRIRIKNIKIKDKKVIVNYLDRYPHEPFSTEPHIAYTKTYEIRNNKLVVGHY
ncbi:MAG: hypothetical protein QM526_01370 [Alphaproteobacteria bacterium]|nr:hypothetical protein [Alphaproteobacteria bacterium]